MPVQAEHRLVIAAVSFQGQTQIVGAEHSDHLMQADQGARLILPQRIPNMGAFKMDAPPRRGLEQQTGRRPSPQPVPILEDTADA